MRGVSNALPDGRKKCSHCKEAKPPSEFPPRKGVRWSLGVDHYCLACHRVLSTQWSKENPEKIVANSRRQNLRQYGLDEAAYSELGDTCRICGAVEPGYGRKNFFIDHDHACCPPSPGRKRSCGECVRGLLCGDCNFGLSKFKDDPKLLRKAADYIENAMAKD